VEWNPEEIPFGNLPFWFPKGKPWKAFYLEEFSQTKGITIGITGRNLTGLALLPFFWKEELELPNFSGFFTFGWMGGESLKHVGYAVNQTLHPKRLSRDQPFESIGFCALEGGSVEGSDWGLGGPISFSQQTFPGFLGIPNPGNWVGAFLQNQRV